LRLGYIGRRGIYDVVRRIAFEVGLFERGDVTVVDAGFRERGEVVLHCGDYRCVATELFTSIPRVLGGGRLGIDLGASKNGLAYVWRGTPLLHAVLDWGAVEKILRGIEGVEIHIGSSPYVDVKKATSLLGCSEVRLVDELSASWSRRWLRNKYPELEEDEIDALSFTYHDGVRASLCGNDHP
jgi:hypothetical protein